jgi:seryl-tRNA synthetase
MITKEELVENVKKWVSYDSEMKNLQKAMKELREKKKNLTKNLIDVMKNHEIDCFDINDGKLLYTKNKIKTPLNKNNLMIALEKYFENQKINVEDVTNFILDNREIKIKENLKKK